MLLQLLIVLYQHNDLLSFFPLSWHLSGLDSGLRPSRTERAFGAIQHFIVRRNMMQDGMLVILGAKRTRKFAVIVLAGG